MMDKITNFECLYEELEHEEGDYKFYRLSMARETVEYVI